MTYCGIEYSLKNRPALDGDFLPFAPWRQAYLAQAAHPIRIAIERQDGQTAVFDTRLRGGAYRQADLRFLERTVKLLLWSVGGWRACLCGCDELADELRRVLFRAEPELEVRIARQQVHLPLRKIQYAMAQNHYVRIVSDDGECRTVSTFSQVEQLLRAQENFIVCNRGVILNMDKVLRLDSDCFEMLDGTRLPVRQKDKNTLFAQFTQYQFRHMRREL